MSKTDTKKKVTPKAKAAPKKAAPKKKVEAKKPAVKKVAVKKKSLAKRAIILSIVYDHDRAKKEGRETDGSAVLVLEGGGSVKVDRAYVKGCGPIIGGSYVRSAKGEESFKPAK
jgi:hypothetical protein